MLLRAHAKINVTLAVGGVRPDGYHDLRSIVAPVSLCDDVALEDAAEIVDETDVDFGSENLAVKAARILRDRAGVQSGVRIRVEKRIPCGAGLGGGSADAAAVLVGLNSLWRLGWGVERLVQVAAEIGSDVPSLVHGGIVMMEGRGERVRPWTDDALYGRTLVLLKPDVHASTPAVYREFRPEDGGGGLNDLQPAACRLYPEIEQALARLEAAGAREVRMTGSGSTVFGFVDGSGEGRRVADALSGFGWTALAVVCGKDGGFQDDQDNTTIRRGQVR